MLDAFGAGELERDFVAVVRFQGPRANGMPELHKLTPPLGALQKKGFRVALVTDGRMSGASGQVPAAIHVSPEVLAGGPLGRVRDGDIVRARRASRARSKRWCRRRMGAPRARRRSRRAGRRSTATASAASSSPACAGTSSRPSRERAHGCDSARPQTLDPLELARHGPVIPVIVIERRRARRADGARARRGRRARCSR